jgi:spore germination cell wall hydrolase CwlJ-like protein
VRAGQFSTACNIKQRIATARFRKQEETIMGNKSLVTRDVPEADVPFVKATTKVNYEEVTAKPQGNGLWTVTGTRPRQPGTQSVQPGDVRAEAPDAVGKPAAMDDLEILARTLWGEGRGGSDEGLEAIAAVVMNRLRAPGERFGRTVAEVCLQPKQFSCWNADDPNRAKILALKGDEPSLLRCRAIARRAIEGGLADPTFGAVHYHHRAIRPNWAQGKQASIRVDDHLFYNNVA